MTAFDSIVLSAAVFSPTLGAGVMMLLPKARQRAHLTIALVASVFTMVAGIGVAIAFDYSSSATGQFGVDLSWIDVINSRYQLSVDGLSLPLVLLTMLITVSCMVYSWFHLPEPVNAKPFLALMLILETGLIGSFLARDLLLFFVFFEVVLLPMYFIVGIWGGQRRQYASLKFFVYTFLGSAFMLAAFLAIYFLGPHTFDMAQLANSPLSALARTTQLLIFGGLFIGFAVKVPVFPLHTWMPDTHTAAPTVASVMLAAVMLKLGAYGLIRIALPILPEAATAFAPWMGLLGVVAIVYGALACLAQTDMKRLVAFSSLAHMGFVMLGISTLSAVGLNAALFAMVAHGLISAMLFFVAGSIQERVETREISDLGGMSARAPKLSWVFGFCVVASFGLPGLAGFWGEFFSILAAFDPVHSSTTGFRWLMVVAAIGALLGVAYSVSMFTRVAFGPVGKAFKHLRVADVTKCEYIAWVPLLALVLMLGVYPAALLDVSNDSINKVADILSGATK